ncbi:MAG: ABC transporter permease [Deltaproteobacteria bacterium]|nr:ABC transporter permease [Deltaproteobacteria bacterium]
MKQSYWRLVWQQYSRSKLAVIALVLVLLMGVLAVGAPWISPYSPDAYDLDQILKAPSWIHWLGTDDLGRDVLSRLLYGSRISLSVGFVAVGIYVAIGIFLGALAGYYGGWIDMLISRAIEVMLCFPTFFLILAVLAFVGPSIYNIMVVIGVTQWTGIARLIRGEFLKFRNQDFVKAVRQQGASNFRIIFKHLLPNSLAPVLVSASFGVAAAILTESALSFLGFGVPPQVPSWGAILSQAQAFMDVAWWLTLSPGFAIFITITAYNLVGEALRDAIDPRLKNV